MLIYLCDKSESDISRLKHYLKRYAEEKNMFFEFVIFLSGEELFDAFHNASIKPELIFMDIFMPGYSGIDTARQLKDMQYQGGIIYTVSSTEHIADSCGADKVYYLNKPYDWKHFVNVMAHCGFILQKTKPVFTFTIKKKQTSIPYSNIVFFETERSHNILLHTVSGVCSFPGVLMQITDFFSGVSCFIPVGRSFLVNLNHVSGKIEKDLLMSDGSIVQVPLRKRAEIFTAWENWQKEISLVSKAR